MPTDVSAVVHPPTLNFRSTIFVNRHPTMANGPVYASLGRTRGIRPNEPMRAAPTSRKTRTLRPRSISPDPKGSLDVICPKILVNPPEMPIFPANPTLQTS